MVLPYKEEGEVTVIVSWKQIFIDSNNEETVTHTSSLGIFKKLVMISMTS